MIPSDRQKDLIRRFYATTMTADPAFARRRAEATIAHVESDSAADLRAAGLAGTFDAMLTVALNRIDELEGRTGPRVLEPKPLTDPHTADEKAALRDAGRGHLIR